MVVGTEVYLGGCSAERGVGQQGWGGLSVEIWGTSVWAGTLRGFNARQECGERQWECGQRGLKVWSWVLIKVVGKGGCKHGSQESCRCLYPPPFSRWEGCG